MKRVALSGLALLAATVALFGDNSTAGQGQVLFDRANAISCLRTAQFSPYELQIQFRLFPPNQMPVSGTYVEIWASREQWRKKITVGDFDEVIVRNKTGEWRAESGGVEAPEVREFRDAVDQVSNLRLEAGEEFQDVLQGRAEKQECVEIRALGPLKRGYCFDSSTAQLQSINWLGQRTSFADYASFGPVSFPRHMKAMGRSGPLWDAEVQNVNHLSSLEQSWFEKPSGSEPYVTCTNVRPPKAVKTQDAWYDPELRRQHVQGSVMWNVEVGADGKTRHLQLVHSDNPAFASASYNAIRTWRFRPAMCGDVPVSVIVHIQTNFRLYR
ncbi:MAG TPA: energy transducer TonB [Terriglobales bacterium]|nr:energy transducer TonB [Terriglobales bacterium]